MSSNEICDILKNCWRMFSIFVFNFVFDFFSLKIFGTFFLNFLIFRFSILDFDFQISNLRSWICSRILRFPSYFQILKCFFGIYFEVFNIFLLHLNEKICNTFLHIFFTNLNFVHFFVLLRYSTFIDDFVTDNQQTHNT